MRLFGKPRVAGHRRVGVTLARGEDIDAARRIARESAAAITLERRVLRLQTIAPITRDKDPR